MRALALVLLFACGRTDLLPLAAREARDAGPGNVADAGMIDCDDLAREGTFSTISPMLSRHSSHSATPLGDGRILVAGGSDDPRTVEIFNPVSRSWTPAGALTFARRSHGASSLADGRVLVAGGIGGQGGLASAEIYDPASNAWKLTSPMATAGRYLLRSVRIPDGRVLAIGGFTYDQATRAVEVWDPRTEVWTEVASMNRPRGYHTATLLMDGRVLVAGGFLETATAEIYDPSRDTWTMTEPMPSGHELHASALLPDGNVVITGGNTDRVVRFNPNNGSWRILPVMLSVRNNHTATVLCTGDVLVVGDSVTAREIYAELYLRRENRWIAAPAPSGPRAFHTAIPLQDGVMIAGGISPFDALSTVELFEIRDP